MIVFVPYSEANIEIANSYLTVDEADQIISAQSNGNTWEALDDPTKQMLLVQSSIAVDGALSYQGTKTTETQVLKFPRCGSYELPIQIKFATAMTAMLYSNDDIFKNMKREKIAKHELEYFEQNAKGVDTRIMPYLEPLRAKSVKVKSVNE